MEKEKCVYCREYGNLPCEKRDKKDLTKYYIDLSKCTEEQQKHIEFLTGEKFYGDKFCHLGQSAFTGNIKFFGFNNIPKGYNKTELTYSEFIKLFEGGDVEKPEKIYTLDEMIGFAKFYILHHAIPYELDVISGKITDEQKIEMLSNDVDYSWNELADEYIKTLNSK